MSFDEANISLSRRLFLGQTGAGLGLPALASLLDAEEVPGSRGLHHPPKAKRVIFLFQSGGPSQMDLFDHKPGLQRFRGTELPPSIRQGQRITTMTSKQDSLPIAPSTYRFRPAGQSGAVISDLLPYTTGIVDDICLIRSVHTDAINHNPAITFFQSGHEFPGRPCIGSWIHYGLGSANENLPAFVVLTSQGAYTQDQPLTSRLWGSGFLPAIHQGVALRPESDPVLYLNDPAGLSPQRKLPMLKLIEGLNQRHYTRTGDPDLLTRTRQYEMAFRMQSSVPELTNLSAEPPATFDLYGEAAKQPGTFAANCLMARRLVERGTRFVQLYHTGWDHHKRMAEFLPKLSQETDRAAAALITDLKRRGLLQDTLVIWGGEFGRTVYSQGELGDREAGRDHHPRCFTIWMAGGGIKPGLQYGRTDDFCYNIEENPVAVHDVQATLLHLLGLDHKKLTYKFQGRRYRLTDVHGTVVRDLIS